MRFRGANVMTHHPMRTITSTLLGLALFTPLSIFAADPPANAEAPRRVAEQLAAVYGHKLDSVVYIPALALVAKLRLSELTGDPKYAAEVNTIVAPYLRGEKSPVPKAGSDQAGHLIFAAFA